MPCLTLLISSLVISWLQNLKTDSLVKTFRSVPQSCLHNPTTFHRIVVLDLALFPCLCERLHYEAEIMLISEYVMDLENNRKILKFTYRGMKTTHES